MSHIFQATSDFIESALAAGGKVIRVRPYLSVDAVQSFLEWFVRPHLQHPSATHHRPHREHLQFQDQLLHRCLQVQHQRLPFPLGRSLSKLPNSLSFQQDLCPFQRALLQHHLPCKPGCQHHLQQVKARLHELLPQPP